MIRQIILLNDVDTEDSEFAICPDVNLSASKTGQQQSIVISKHLSDLRLDIIVASPAVRLSKLLHNLRQRGGKNLSTTTGSSVVMQSIPVYYSDDMFERNFGVLNNSTISKESSIFTHSRICVEGGESIEQCRLRSFSCLKGYCDKYPDKNIVFVSHPHVCQILFNVMSNESILNRNEIWWFKGTCAVFDCKEFSNILVKFYNILHHEHFAEKNQ